MMSIIFSINLLWGAPVMYAQTITTQTEVIVVGSEPEGIYAAISASREGAKVVLVTQDDYLGGLYTAGMLSMVDLNYYDGLPYNLINTGLFNKFYEDKVIHGSFDIDAVKQYFKEQLILNKVAVIYKADNIKPIMNGKKTEGITFTKEGDSYTLKGNIVIDAAPDAPIATLAGCEYYIGRTDLGLTNECASSTLAFSLKHVAWTAVKRHINAGRNPKDGFTENTAWGYDDAINFKSSDPSRFQLRRLNISRQTNGDIVINAFQIFNVDVTSQEAIAKAYAEAKAELPNVVAFMKANLKGFEKAQLGDVADSLYIREGVHIIGEETLGAEDVFTNKNFTNRIAYGSYPTDLQSTKRDGVGGTILSARNPYAIPLGIIIPKGYPNLIVVGRSASYDSIAHSSARTVPVGIAVAEASGIVAAYSVSTRLPLQTINTMPHITKIQNALRVHGVNLDVPLPTSWEEQSSYAYPYIKALREKALISKARNNKNTYACYEVATYSDLVKITTLIKSNSNLKVNAIPTYSDDTVLTPHLALSLTNTLFGFDCISWEEYYAQGIIDKVVYTHISKTTELKNEDLYAIMSNAITKLTQQTTGNEQTLEER